MPNEDMTMNTNAKRNIIVIAMGAAVPRHAIGYVADLASLTRTPAKEADCLLMLRRYCPDLVEQYIAAKAQ